jgi:hypothetical protein
MYLLLGVKSFSYLHKSSWNNEQRIQNTGCINFCREDYKHTLKIKLECPNLISPSGTRRPIWMAQQILVFKVSRQQGMYEDFLVQCTPLKHPRVGGMI